MFVDWSWWAFVAGVLATITVEFWLVILIAFKQWKKQQKQQQKNAASWGSDWTVDRMFGQGDK